LGRKRGIIELLSGSDKLGVGGGLIKGGEVLFFPLFSRGRQRKRGPKKKIETPQEQCLACLARVNLSQPGGVEEKKRLRGRG